MQISIHGVIFIGVFLWLAAVFFAWRLMRARRERVAFIALNFAGNVIAMPLIAYLIETRGYYSVELAIYFALPITLGVLIATKLLPLNASVS